MTIELSPRPDWLTEACPRWCSGDHAGQELEADRAHFSEFVVLPVIERRIVADLDTGEPGTRLGAEGLTMVAFQRVGDFETWVAIGTESTWMQISRESAHRLSHELCVLLDELVTQ